MNKNLKITVLLVVAVSLMGCGVSKEVYQEQFVKARDTEAVNADLKSRLDAANAKLKGTSKALEQEKSRNKSLVADLEAAKETFGERTAQLESCKSSRDELSVSLDVARLEIQNAEKDIAELREMIDAEKASGGELSALYDKEISQLKEKIEVLRGRIISVEADRAVLIEEREKLEREKREKVEELSDTYEGLLANMKEEIDKGRITISQLKGKLSVNLLNEILFDSGSAKVKEEGKEVLQQIAVALEGVDDKAIEIEGHTDNVQIIGGLANRFPTNWELSTARAVSVVRYLTEDVGVDPLRVAAVGYGENRPIADNGTAEGRAQNRRIEIKLIPLDPDIATLLSSENSEEVVEGVEESEAEAAGEEADAEEGVEKTSEDSAKEAPEEAPEETTAPSETPETELAEETPAATQSEGEEGSSQ